MAGAVKVLGGVLVFRIVTATDMTADPTYPQMHPRVARGQTFFAARGAWGDVADLIEMRAALIHRLRPFVIEVSSALRFHLAEAADAS